MYLLRLTILIQQKAEPPRCLAYIMYMPLIVECIDLLCDRVYLQYFYMKVLVASPSKSSLGEGISLPVKQRGKPISIHIQLEWDRVT